MNNFEHCVLITVRSTVVHSLVETDVGKNWMWRAIGASGNVLALGRIFLEPVDAH